MFSKVASLFAPLKGVKPYSSSYMRMPKLHLRIAESASKNLTDSVT